MSNLAIKIENLSKQYRLGLVGTGTISHDLNRWFTMNILKKEDPFLKIGEVNNCASKGNSKYVWALKDINLEIEKGDVLGIIGKNGAGKSTLLKILSKVTKPTNGTIKYNGKIASLLEVGTGFHPEMTGRENIFMNGSIMGMTKTEIKYKLDEIIDFAGIERYIDTPVKRYSSGMIVRLGFAIAAHLEPDILVVDEVLAVGDAEFQKKAIGKMKDVSNGKGRTVLFVSHNMGAVRNLCKNGIVLKDGIINFVGEVEECITKYTSINTKDYSQTLKNRTDRQGNGKFRFINIQFLDKNNNEIVEILTGETLKIKIFYKKNEDIEMEKMIFDVSIKDNYENYILQFISDEIGSMFKENEDNSITLEIPELLLRGGTYNVRLFATYKTTATENHCDNIENAAILNVHSSDFWGTGKIIRNRNTAICKGIFTT